MIGNYIIRLEETASTNRYASELLNANYTIAEGTVILANDQQSGRGAGDNKWESEKGKNLTLSIVLYPAFLQLEKQFMINKLASLSVYDMIVKLLEGKRNVKVKWPNDIYVDNKKISGTLIENAIVGNTFRYAILGIGININQEVFRSDAPNPVSLKNITGKDHDLQECLAILCSSLDSRYAQLKNSEERMLNENYLSALLRMNETALYIHKGQMITAKITGLDVQGKLLLEKNDGQMIDCDFKEIEFVI
jgi:BirA family transcriptional regulator, biotin operon repressor / biotin---[acetyl-CoA-carboxylase] ligase